MILMNKKLNSDEEVAKRKRFYLNPKPNKNEMGILLKTKATHFVRAVKNSNGLKPNRPPKKLSEKLKRLQLLPATAEIV
jgi:hypothetical protein